ncbi:DnaJ family domain-containing protein [Priestia koreensis]|uniref:DnaJ family domain-containing protein n=1 Tax=Priestia koreensis TaxID=284581 RepID=UPI001F5810DC|nr:DnaJ family domain-containing protein [Priestia koreensis]MCM3006371.1 DUF1992 domain-containing protein [Priestia koreensis]UNL83724.1 DUF1992 domain-containing protein [Priestia koreensis]
MENKYNDLIGDMLKNSGDQAPLKGQGKPLSQDYFKRDVFQNFERVARDAGYLPPWLQLQKEISALVRTCQTEEEVNVINEKIKKHNVQCPPPMQKGFISLQNLERAKKMWEE